LTQEPFHIRSGTPEDAAAVARVHVDSWRTTYRGIVPDDFLAQLSYERSATQWRQALAGEGERALFVVQTAAGQIPGFASAGRERGELADFHGELWAIYLLAEVQGRGLGRRLLHEVAAWLVSSGIHNMAAWVLEENPARGFYEALGGRLVGAKDIVVGGATLPEVAYGWDDLSALCRRAL
jgi:GNAT superfamily N-acetyltransferase